MVEHFSTSKGKFGSKLSILNLKGQNGKRTFSYYFFDIIIIIIIVNLIPNFILFKTLFYFKFYSNQLYLKLDATIIKLTKIM